MLAAAGIWAGIDRSANPKSPITASRLSDGNRASPNAEANADHERSLLFGGAGTANPAQAQRMLERALELDPGFAAARAEIAFFHVVRILNGRSNDSNLFYAAESEVRQALRDDPHCGRAHSVLALTYLMQGRKDLVRAELDQALKENPVDPTAHGWLIDYHRANGDHGEALKASEWLARQWPLFWPAHLTRGELLREGGDTAGGIRELERVLEQDAQNVDGLAALARAHIEAGDLPKAHQTLDRAHADDRANFGLRLQRATLLALEGKKDEASLEMDAGLLAFAGMYIFGPVAAAEFYAVMGDVDKALEWLDRAARLGDDRDEYFRRNRLLTNLRPHPRFQQILDAVAYRRQQRRLR